ncbi:hypothetical protein NWFMUON74_09690 [Nocardia wallacei]|uniref:non-specific serine/threonine protein kinase n=1 Tax=Nocardia wallacei TaxID=480035 RepID=A0A7G1KD82_9NOCA|nr:hypothetical protein NWFMUON74_09690 [Nocardia wallacei]
MAEVLASGTVIAGFVIERCLGSGGMGSVYRARDDRLGRKVSLKLLHQRLMADGELRRRFEREARLAARLDHPNVVAVYGTGVLGGRLWIAMQYIDGSDVRGCIGRYGMDTRDAVRIVSEIAGALDYAHNVGVVHRDVNPANILLQAQSGRAYLTDFGIAGAADLSTQLTVPGSVLATFNYAAPEQLEGRTVGARSDQYSLACTVFHMLTGRAPFQAESASAVIAGHLSARVPLVSEYRPQLGWLDAIVARAMAKHPADRYVSCGEFGATLEKALSARGAARTVIPKARQAPRRLVRRPSVPVRKTERRHMWPLIFLPLMLVLVGGGILVSCVRNALDPSASKADSVCESTQGNSRTAGLSDSGPRPVRFWQDDFYADLGHPETIGLAGRIDDHADPAVWNPTDVRSVQLVACATGPSDGDLIRRLDCPGRSSTMRFVSGKVRIFVHEARTARLVTQVDVYGEVFPWDVRNGTVEELCAIERTTLDPLRRSTAWGKPTPEQVRQALEPYVMGPKP